MSVVRMLSVGGVGAVILELYSWEPVFTGVGLLAAMWAFGVWKYLLKGRIYVIIYCSRSVHTNSYRIQGATECHLELNYVCVNTF